MEGEEASVCSQVHRSRAPEQGSHSPVASPQAGAATQASMRLPTGHRCAPAGFSTSPAPRGRPGGLTWATTPQICVCL